MRFKWVLLTLAFVHLYTLANASAPTSPPLFEGAWGQCCSGDGNFNDPQDIAIASDGTVYVVDFYGIQRFAADGTFLSQWAYPTGSALDIDSAGNIYVASWTKISKLSNAGMELMHWGSEGEGYGEFSGIFGLAIGPNGTIYAADCPNHRIEQFAPDSTFIRAWGTEGPVESQLVYPTGIAVDATGNVYVGDQGLGSIQKYSDTGEFLASIPLPGQNVRMIHDVTVGPQGEIYMVNMALNDVDVMDATGTPLFYWGGSGSGNGQFKFPIAIGISTEGSYYVVDYGNDRVQRFGYPVGVSKISWGMLKTRFTN